MYHNRTKCQEALFFFFSRKARIFVFRSHYKTLCFGNNQFVNINELQQDLQRTFSFSDDFKCRRLDVGGKHCLFAYIDGNIDKILLEQDVVRPLKNCERLEKPYLQSLQNTVAYADEIEIVDIKDSPQSVASCDVAFFYRGRGQRIYLLLAKTGGKSDRRTTHFVCYERAARGLYRGNKNQYVPRAQAHKITRPRCENL